MQYETFPAHLGQIGDGANPHPASSSRAQQTGRGRYAIAGLEEGRDWQALPVRSLVDHGGIKGASRMGDGAPHCGWMPELAAPRTGITTSDGNLQ